MERQLNHSMNAPPNIGFVLEKLFLELMAELPAFFLTFIRLSVFLKNLLANCSVIVADVRLEY